MKTFRFEALDGLDKLVRVDEDDPRPQRGEVLIRIRAVALNRRDLLIVQGRYPGPVRPGLIPCSDASGEIVEVGEDVTAFSVGDRVISTFHPRWFGGLPPRNTSLETYGNARDGWLAEYKVVSQEAAVLMPTHHSFVEASTLPCAGLTAWNALSGEQPVRAGSSVLTLGTGGVSIFAVQLAKACGARVVATTSDARKAEQLTTLGADCTINYHDRPDWGREARRLTGGRGVDVVVEVVGPVAINEALEAVRRSGEVVQIGQLSMDKGGIDTSLLKRSGARLRSIGVGDREQLEELVRVTEACDLHPLVDRVLDFVDSAHAFATLLNDAPMGKVVIAVGQ